MSRRLIFRRPLKPRWKDLGCRRDRCDREGFESLMKMQIVKNKSFVDEGTRLQREEIHLSSDRLEQEWEENEMRARALLISISRIKVGARGGRVLASGKSTAEIQLPGDVKGSSRRPEFHCVRAISRDVETTRSYTKAPG